MLARCSDRLCAVARRFLPARARIESQGDSGFSGLTGVEADRSGATGHRVLLDLEGVDRADGRAVLVEDRHHAPGLPVSQQLEARAALIDAIWEIPLPLVVLGGVYSGFFAISEAAAVTAGRSIRSARLFSGRWERGPR